uniref:Uncharacterized protein n=1 Tax=Solibacter usitatus (strain Ellin6076) TaxID=234267 RepID=Q01P43_SOLUE
MCAIRVLGITLLAAVSIPAEECAVNVTLLSGNLATAAVMIKAKTVTAGIFAGIGVELSWSKAAMDTRSCIPRIVARLEVTSDPGERPDSLAYASVGVRADRQIHIFIDRVAAMVPESALGILLGHVLAHEITHVLEGVPRHSERGVMKARWEHSDLQYLVNHPLHFDPIDAALIRAALSGPDE